MSTDGIGLDEESLPTPPTTEEMLPVVDDVASVEENLAELDKETQAPYIEDAPISKPPTPTSVDDLDGLEGIINPSDSGLEEDDTHFSKKTLQSDEIFVPPFHEQLIAQDKEIPAGKNVSFAHAFNTIARAFETIDQYIQSFPNEDIRNTTLGDTLKEAIETARETALLSDTLEAAANAQGVKMHQKVPYLDKGAISASLLNPTGNVGKRLEGESAVLRLNYALGEKRIIRFPLYGTGIWLAIKPPSDDAIYTLYTELTNDRETIGRSTGGGIFSNSQVIVMQRLLVFAIDHVYETNYKINNRASLLSIIRLPDIHQLLTYTLAAIHQAGFPFTSTCIANPDRCNYQRKAMLNIPSLSRTFTDKLSDDQKRFIYTKPSSVDDEALEKYQKDFAYSENLRVIELSDRVSVQLRIPTLQEYFDVGNIWVSGLIERADKGLSVKLEGKKRETYLDNLAKMSILRQYGHWVESFTLDGEAITDRNSIDLQLNRLSSNQVYVDKLFGTLDKFITESTITICALVEDKACPKCGGVHTDVSKGEQPYTNLIVLDPCALFFTLAGLHIARILSRV